MVTCGGVVNAKRNTYNVKHQRLPPSTRTDVWRRWREPLRWLRIAGPQCGGLEPGVGFLGVVGDGGSALEVGGAGFAVGSSVYGDAAGNHPGVADLDALKHRSCVYPFHCCPFRFRNIRTPLQRGRRRAE